VKEGVAIMYPSGQETAVTVRREGGRKGGREEGREEGREGGREDPDGEVKVYFK